MMTLPAKTRRKKQPYVAIRSRLFRRQIEKQALLFLSEVRGYLEKQAIVVGAPFLRFAPFDANGEGDMEFGFFTERQYGVPTPMRSGVLPGGSYMSAIWRGGYERLYDVNMMLLGWGKMTDTQWETAVLEQGGLQGCRLAIFHQTSRHMPDPQDWLTELAFLQKAG